MMQGLADLRHRQVTRMNVPVHQIMFTSDRDALPPPAAEEIRSRAGGDPYRMWFLDDARALISDVYGLEVLRAFDILRPFAYKADLARYCIVNHIGGIYIDLSVTDFLGFDVGDYEFVGFRDREFCRDKLEGRKSHVLLDQGLAHPAGQHLRMRCERTSTLLWQGSPLPHRTERARPSGCQPLSRSQHPHWGLLVAQAAALQIYPPGPGRDRSRQSGRALPRRCFGGSRR